MEVSNIRAESRAVISNERNNKRRFELDQRRNIEQIRYREKSPNVEEIAEKLKTKSAISCDELKQLKNCLIIEDCINTFMITHGALRGLIRELTGTDAERQMEAASCLCNLALSETRSAQIIAKAAGSYLLPCIHSLNLELAKTCAWTVGNLAGAHERVCDILVTQGALSVLIKILVDTADRDVADAACYALLRLCYNLGDNLASDQLANLCRVLIKKGRCDSSFRILFVLSCQYHFAEHVSEDFLSYLVDEFCTESMEESTNSDFEKDMFIIRILANSCISRNLSDFILKCLQEPKAFDRVEKTLLNRDKLRNNMLWLLGNLFNTCTQDNINSLFFKSISDKICTA